MIKLKKSEEPPEEWKGVTWEEVKKERMGETITVLMKVSLPASADGISIKVLKKDGLYELPRRLGEVLIKEGKAVQKRDLT